MDLFSELNKLEAGKSVILCTTNGAIHSGRKALVMGKGAALTMKQYAWNSDRLAAADILRRAGEGRALFRGRSHQYDLYEYGLCFMGEWNGIYIGGFQVKIHFSQNAELALIQESARQLYLAATKNNDWVFRFNYPGIGAGRLTKEQVEPLLSTLPDNVHIYSL